MQDTFGDLGRVCSLSLRDRDGDRRKIACCCVLRTSGRSEQDVVGWLGRTIVDVVGYIAQINWPAVPHADDDLREILRRAEKAPSLDLEFRIRFGETARDRAC